MPLTDVLGSTLGLVDASGSLATQYSYEPFGVPTSSGQSSNYPYLFAGMEYDAATGLYHTPARYYSPRLQRFLSEDPLQFGGGSENLFGYVGNDPADLSDRLGLYCAYGFTGPIATAGTAADVGGGAIGLGMDAALLGTVLGSVSVGGSGAATGVGGGVGPTGATTLAAMGISSGQIVLAQAEGPPPEDDEEPGVSPRSPEAWGEAQIRKHVKAVDVLEQMGRPDWAHTPGGFVSWLRNLQREGKVLTAEQADGILEESQILGIKARADLAGHPGTPWPMPHLNVGKKGDVHLQVPDGYTPTKSLP